VTGHIIGTVGEIIEWAIKMGLHGPQKVVRLIVGVYVDVDIADLVGN
jgi:hypothetical protein